MPCTLDPIAETNETSTSRAIPDWEAELTIFDVNAAGLYICLYPWE